MLHPLRAPIRRLPIREAALRSGLTNRAIRFYEERGLVRCERGPAGQRLYDDKAVDRLAFIAAIRRVGLGLREVAALLKCGDRDGNDARALAGAEACRRRLDDLHAQCREAEAVVADLTAQSLALAPPLKAARR